MRTTVRRRADKFIRSFKDGLLWAWWAMAISAVVFFMIGLAHRVWAELTQLWNE